MWIDDLDEPTRQVSWSTTQGQATQHVVEAGEPQTHKETYGMGAVRISKHHAIRIILAGATSSYERPKRGVKPHVRVANQARGNRERFKLWLLMNPDAIPFHLARKLRRLNGSH